jgi:hypothetical protein
MMDPEPTAQLTNANNTMSTCFYKTTQKQAGLYLPLDRTINKKGNKVSHLRMIILLSAEALLILLANLFLDNKLAIWGVFVIMLIAAIKTLSHNNVGRKLLGHKLKVLGYKIAFYGKKQEEQQHRQDKYESSPHVFATTIIKINGLVTLEGTTVPITSATDNEVGNIEVNIDNPDHYLLIPNVESDSIYNVCVKTNASNNSVRISWT